MASNYKFNSFFSHLLAILLTPFLNILFVYESSTIIAYPLFNYFFETVDKALCSFFAEHEVESRVADRTGRFYLYQQGVVITVVFIL